MAPEGVMPHPIGRAILQGPPARRVAALVVRVGALRRPARRAEPGGVAVTGESARIRVRSGPAGRAGPRSVGRFGRLYVVLAQP